MLCVGIDEHGSELLEEDGVQHLAVLGEQRDGMRLPQQLVGLDATQQKKKATHTTQSHQLQQIILYYGETMQPSNEQSRSHKGDTHIHTYIQSAFQHSMHLFVGQSTAAALGC